MIVHRISCCIETDIRIQHEAHAYPDVSFACDELWPLQENGNLRASYTHLLCGLYMLEQTACKTGYKTGDDAISFRRIRRVPQSDYA